MHKHEEVHWCATLWILAYIKKSPGRVMWYKRNGHLKIDAFSDSHYVDDQRY